MERGRRACTHSKEPAGTACFISNYHSGQSSCPAQCSAHGSLPQPQLYAWILHSESHSSFTHSMQHLSTPGRHCSRAGNLTFNKRPFLCSSVHDRRLQAQHRPCHGLFPQRQALLSLQRTAMFPLEQHSPSGEQRSLGYAFKPSAFRIPGT